MSNSLVNTRDQRFVLFEQIGIDKLFWPGAVSFDGNYLWVGEFKFSGRILRFSPS